MREYYIKFCFTYLREASALLLVQRIKAMRRPQTEEQATSTDLTLFYSLVAKERVLWHKLRNENLQKIIYF